MASLVEIYKMFEMNMLLTFIYRKYSSTTYKNKLRFSHFKHYLKIGIDIWMYFYKYIALKLMKNYVKTLEEYLEP